MKKGIHPEYYVEAKMTCSCGNVFYVGSTKKEMETEICYACHPFYTGEEKLIDTEGRVEKFISKSKKASKSKVVSKKVKRQVKAKKKTLNKDKKTTAKK